MTVNEFVNSFIENQNKYTDSYAGKTYICKNGMGIETFDKKNIEDFKKDINALKFEMDNGYKIPSLPIIIDSFPDIDPSKTCSHSNAISILKKKDNIMSRFKVVNITETTKEVKIPQHKAAPKKEIRKVVNVTLKSGNTWEAVCLPQDEDKYDIKEAVKVAILCELFGGKKQYNDFLREAEKFYMNIQKENEKAKAEEERIANRKEKNDKRKAALKAKHEEKERQEKVNLYADAMLIALNKFSEGLSELKSLDTCLQNMDKVIDDAVNEFINQ